MIQQLWYTWSTNGYGISNGLRVRAASADLTKTEGPRVRSYIPLLEYKLPATTDRHLPADQAPLCLTFLKAGSAQETVLIQKTHLGLDKMDRPGNFFSHLLTDLPSPTGQIPFSAREAISFWRAPLLWRSSESDWPARELKLPTIAPNDLFSQGYTGPINSQSVADISSLFKHVFSAFLTLAHQNGNKRLYLVGHPEIVAILIWGITHALPRTLPIMQNLTFSTFEANVETDAKPLIVGTCWQPLYLKQDSEQAILNLPSSYYEPNNPSGIAIHCTTLDSTPFDVPTALTPLLSEYLQFVQDCFAGGSSSLTILSHFLNSAEKRNIRDLPSLFYHYVERYKPLAAEDVTRVLQRLFDKALEVIQQIDSILQQETFSSALTLYSQLGNTQAEIEDFMRENVQLSLLTLLFNQPEWWTNQGEKLIQKLYQLSTRPFQEQLSLSSKHFVQHVLSSKQWKNQHGADLLPALAPFAQNQNSESAPGELLLEFTKQVEYQRLYLQQDLKKALLSLGETLIDQLGQVIRSDQNKDLISWQRVLSVYLNSPTVWPEIWIHLLKTLSVGMNFNSTYNIWWKGSKQYIRTIHAQAQKLANPRLNGSLSSFAASIAQSLLIALQTTTTTGPALSFWSELFQIVSPPSKEPIAWAAFLDQLSSLPFTPHYQQWYNEYGEQDLKELLPLARQHTESSLPQSLETFRSSVSAFLLSAVRADQKEALTLFNALLLQIAPPESMPTPWLDFLFELRTFPASPGFISWWEQNGQQTILTLRALAENKKLSPESQLLPFAQNSANLLFECLKEEINQNQHAYDKLITYLLALLIAVLPTSDSQIWPNLLQQLSSQNYLYLHIRWDLRAELLRHWKTIIILTHAEAQANINLWLKVSWLELDPLLSLDLPKSWQIIALASALETYQSTPADLVLKTVPHHYKLFEDYLQNLLQQAQTEPTLSFFAFLAQHDYERKLPLLELLLAACNYQLDLSERLLQSANITSNEEIILLEKHSQILLASHELPPTILQFLERYMTTFDLDRLDKSTTQKLFLSLQQREKSSALRLSDSFHQAVEGWYTIVDFLTQQQGNATTLRAFIDKLLAMPRLEPATQKKLATKLLPTLVPLITTETELALVLYALSQNHGQDLLPQMTKLVSDRFGKTDIPIGFALYVRVILAEGNQLPPDERDSFVTLCFQSLFKEINESTRKKYFPEPLWRKSLKDTWEQAMQFHDTFISLKKALDETAYVPDMASFYQLAFEPLLNENEREIITLARRFIAEYEAHNDQAMLQDHENLKQHYPTGLYYKPEQVQRIRAARQKLSPSVSGPLPALSNKNKPILSEYNPLNNGDRYSQNVINVVNNSHIGNNLATQPASYQPPENPLPPSATTPPQIVAEVLGNKILLETLNMTMDVKRAYLQMQLEQKQRDWQQLQIADVKAAEKKLLQHEIDEISNLLNDVLKFRQRTLFELIDDVFIQQELLKLSKDAKHKEWCQKFFITIEQQASSTFENLKQKHSWDNSWNFQDAGANEQFKQALCLFIRYETFQSKYLQNTSMEDWAKEMRKDVFIDFKAAKIPKPKFGFFRR